MYGQKIINRSRSFTVVDKHMSNTAPQATSNTFHPCSTDISVKRNACQNIIYEPPCVLFVILQGCSSYNLSGMMVWQEAMDFPNNSVLQFVASRQAPPARPCGDGYIGLGVCADQTQCCGSRGYCGLAFCGAGCVNGPCALEPLSPPPFYACGNGLVGSKLCNDGSCCTSEG